MHRHALSGLRSLLFLPCLLAWLCCCGCHEGEDHSPELLRIQSGDSQMAPAGAECPEMLVVQVMGSIRRGMLGGQGKRQPAVGVKVRVAPVSEGAGVEPMEGSTDQGGNFRCRIRLAHQFGDQYFKVSCPDFEEVKPFFVHAVAGISISGNNQETQAGDELLNPIQVTVKDAEGEPRIGVPVFFSLKSGNPSAKLSASRVMTDASGRAAIMLRTAEGFTGKYEILAEIGDGEMRTRGIIIRAMAIGYGNLIIGVLGGLAIFIFGMNFMSDGLQQVAGDKLKNLLQLFTGNRVKAMMAGLVVTALIQSSGACTVMVVGFVNAALINLTQAIGIILGSAIGTTVTAQMVSLKLDFVALPCIILGVLGLLIAKKSQSKGIAVTVLGFGLLFYGMTIMSGQMKSIAEFPTFVSFFQKFDCTPAEGSTALPFLSVLGAIAVGMIMTIIVQSSSVTVGIAIALADSGLLSFYTAVPLILGDNIGSTVTGLLASLNASRAARQSAVAATVFKILGVLIMVPLLYVTWNGHPCFMELVAKLTNGDVFAPIPENIGRHLANSHTLFNIIAVALFLPLVHILSAITRCIIPDRNNEDERDNLICHLEQRLLNTPSAALSQVLIALIAMADAAMSMTRKCIASLTDYNKAAPEEEIDHEESRIDGTQRAIIDYLVMLTRRNLNISQSSAIPIFMHCVNDVERIGDRAVNIYELIPAMRSKEMVFSKAAIEEIGEIQTQLDRMVRTLIDGFRANDLDAIQKVVAMDTEIKHLTARFERSHEGRLKDHDCTVEKGLVFVELLANLERISAHLTNIAERAKDMLPHSVSFQRENATKTAR